MLSISTAYVQLFWRAAKHATKVNKVEEIDALFSAFSNLLAFRIVSAWKKYPLLLILALVGWLFPIAFIVPPSTLIASLAVKSTSTLQDVPNFDFSSLRYVASIPQKASEFIRQYKDDTFEWYTEYSYNGPNKEVKGIATATAVGGSILPITPTAANSSWELDFYGPSVRCSKVGKPIQLRFEKDIARWLWNETNSSIREKNCFKPEGFIAWSADVESNSNTVPGPYHQIHLGNSTIGSLDNSDYPFSGIYIALIPHIFDTMLMSTHYTLTACFRESQTSASKPLADLNATMLQCGLYNASYHVEFRFESGIQSVDTQVKSLEALKATVSVRGPARSCCKFAPPKVNVSSTTYALEYGYNANQLWTAYGVAIAITLVSICIGFMAIGGNGATYSNDFSSVYRITHQAILSVTMQQEDTDATNPLPNYLGKSYLRLVGTRSFPRKDTQEMAEERDDYDDLEMLHDATE
ncbi:hypothetical protein F4808DRAFT_454730 [Astrocystis sublimbata]|nr:hypothetical protein F4808DRAFT_454730 [Astrocystis sublimbata]